MANGQATITRDGFGDTQRRDRWWVQPLLTFLGLSAFIVYSTYRAFNGTNFLAIDGGTNYLSPFFSPILYFHEVSGNAALTGAIASHAWIGTMPAWAPAWVSPAFFILWAPAGFRFTCYYYRGAYYKAFWGDPPNCSVGEPRDSYRGEQRFPLIFQNIHRYFFYVAAVFIFILGYDAFLGMQFSTDASGKVLADGKTQFGLGVGSLVLWGNVFFLGSYTFGCHSFRHLIGGGINLLSKTPVASKCYECVGCLNSRHMLFAWCSLFWVGFTDVYVWMCASNTWTDYRIF
jgi:hypothetical protein